MARLGLGLRRLRNPILGMECAGTVEAVGRKATTFAPGDDVIVMRAGAFGCHAEFTTIASGT